MHDSAPFAPVPTASARRDGWTPNRQRAFVAALAEHGGIAAAARSVGMTPQSLNRLRRRPGADGFNAACDAALDAGRTRARDEAVRRGLTGWLAPVVHDGRIVGHRRRWDNRLLFAACYGRPMRGTGRAGAADTHAAFEAALANLSRKLSG